MPVLISDFWLGLSGTRPTGEAVAAHLDAAATLMKRDNWDPQLYEPSAGRHVVDALRHVAADGKGDADTRYIARKCMELLLRERLGVGYVDCWVWSEHRDRTLADVLELLAAAAAFARNNGPR